MKRVVSDEEYNEALKNPDYIKIGKSVISKFRFDKDLRKECWMMGLYFALANFNGKKDTKFTTYLYYRILWYCLKAVKEKQKSRKNRELKENYSYEVDFDRVFLLDQLSENHTKILLDKYLEKYSLKEIAERHNVSIETIRKRIMEALDFLKNEENGV